MIIFDLDGTLADCEHRRHYVDPLKNDGVIQWCDTSTGKTHYGTGYIDGIFQKWKPNWEAFYDDCDKDTPIQQSVEIYESLLFENDIRCGHEIEIWSGRCESVRKKTELWLELHVWGSVSRKLRMRKIGDSTPDDILKERWLDESLSEDKKIDFVFDDRPKVVRMWRRRGIFVFDANQSREEF